MPTHTFNPPAHDGETNPCASIFVLYMSALEQTENAFLVAWGDADPVVFDPETYHRPRGQASFCPNFDSGCRARRHELDGIREKIDDNLCQQGRMCAHTRQRFQDIELQIPP